MEGLTTLILAAGSSLGAAIVVLFKTILKQADSQSALSGRIGKLEGEHRGITELSAKTLEVVHKSLTDPDSVDIDKLVRKK